MLFAVTSALTVVWYFPAIIASVSPACTVYVRGDAAGVDEGLGEAAGWDVRAPADAPGETTGLADGTVCADGARDDESPVAAEATGTSDAAVGPLANGVREIRSTAKATTMSATSPTWPADRPPLIARRPLAAGSRATGTTDAAGHSSEPSLASELEPAATAAS